MDGRGNRLTEQYEVAGETAEVTEYGYDGGDRLTGVRYPDGTAHLYWLGGDGRRKGERKQPGHAGPLGPDAFWLSGADAAEYLYDLAGGLSGIQDVATGTELGTVASDAAGRVTSLEYQGRTRTMTWDVAGRLRDVSVPGGVSGSTTVTYAYDAQGRRVGSQAGTSLTRWVWGAGELLEERGPANSGSGPAQVYERVGAVAVAAGGERLLHDALGSTVGRWDGTEATLHRYDAWGGYVAGASGAGSPATAPGPGDPSIGYTGHQWDATASLVYAKARWYAPELGSFLSRDPVLGVPGNPVTWNAFGYANGNPLAYTDPDGRSGTVVGSVAGFFWGFTQMAAMGAKDIWHGRIRKNGAWDYLSIWGQNIVGGFEMGLAADASVLSAGLALPVAAGFGNAGFGALTFEAEPEEMETFGKSQVQDFTVGAMLGPVLVKFAGGLGRFGGWVIKRVPWANRAASFVTRKAGEYAGRLSDAIFDARYIDDAVQSAFDDLAREMAVAPRGASVFA